MIQGATIRRASAIRTAAETTTIPASQSQAGTATARARTAATALTISGHVHRPRRLKGTRNLRGLPAMSGDSTVTL